ncbi:unnamed protein product [Periconia digitata]|uniref:Uncharacterized protein n=1 Tax=Periconia digitata TaxID=1303443 RepID=A0A9W4UJ63_9PLEO|nr:unnamed protein product [Periconia digitata]
MASPDTLRSRSPSSSSTSSNTTMNDAPPSTPIRPRPQSQTTSTMARSLEPAFRFFDLPQELRDRIYTYALVSPYPFWWPAASTPKHNVALSLLRASRQTHDEAAPILYTHNKFLFTHPSDCNMFRVIASPYSQHITTVYLRIREKEMGLWTSYLSSTKEERSLKHDLPNLKTLWVFLRSGSLGANPLMMGGALGGLIAAGGGVAAAAGGGGLGGHVQHLNPAQLAAHMHNVQQNLGGQINHQLTAFHQQIHNQIQALHNQVHNALGQGSPFAAALQMQHPLPPPAPLTPHNVANAMVPPVPPPPPPPPAYPQQAMHPTTFTALPHPYPLFASFLRWERELGLDQLCLSLHETCPPTADVKIVAIVKLPKADVTRLLETYPDELSADRNGDLRTRFRRVRGLDVCLEVSGVEPASAVGVNA